VKEVQLIARLALVALLLSACAEPGLVPGSATPGSATSGSGASTTAGEPTDAAAATPPATLPPLPGGFPVHQSMADVEAEIGEAAAWESDALLPEIYDFYLAELPAAGYVIDLEGPGGAAAIIRFTSPDGIAYQLDITGPSPVRVTLGAPHE
jgi:hypothetical protein